MPVKLVINLRTNQESIIPMTAMKDIVRVLEAWATALGSFLEVRY